MPKASPIQNAFNAGEVSPLLGGRTDVDKYRKACRILENFIPLIPGPVTKRSGTRFVKPVVNSAHNVALIPFQFSTTQAYILEFGDLYMRVYRNNGLVLESAQSITGVTAANPAELTITGHSYTTGDEVFITGTGVSALDGRYFTITVTGANTFTVPADGTGWSSGGTASRVYELVTPFAHTDVRSLAFAQSADVLYVAHESYAPIKITRTGHTAWTQSEITFNWAPFLSENIDTAITAYSSAATGAVTLTASSGIFTADMVGGFFKFREQPATNSDIWPAATAVTAGAEYRWSNNVYSAGSSATTGNRPPIHESGTEFDGGVSWTYLHSGEGYVKITGFTSSTVVTGTVIRRLPGSVVGAGNATFRWSMGAWSAEYGYPRAVTFYEDRLLWAGSTNNPQTIWGSKSGDYENHQSGVDDDDAYIYTINTDQVNVIEWLSSGKVLFIGTVGGEFIMSASSLDEAITPTNVRVVERQSKGSKEGIPPVRLGDSVLFVQRSGRKVRELFYSFDNDSYQATDRTLLSDRVSLTGLTGVAYQQEPNQLVWYTRTDGQLACLTHEREEDVIGWHRHIIGGTDAKVEAVASIPHPDGDQDQLWMVVSRTIDGGTKKYIEYLEKNWDESLDQEDGFFVDSGLTYDGSPVSSVSGLDHLEGESVTIVADGATHPNKTVSSGSVTLDRSGSVIHIGMAYTAKLQTMRFEAGAADGTAQGKTKRIHDFSIRLYQTGPGLWAGPGGVDMEEIQFRDSGMAMDSPVPLFDGDKTRIEWPGGYEEDGGVTLEHRLPLPCTIISIMPQLVTEDS